MIEGLWIVQFEGLQGRGSGVVVLANGRAFGGDAAYTYVGDYKVHDGVVSARVTVSNFLPGTPSVMGINNDYDLLITAPLGDGVIQGSMCLVSNPAIAVAVKLTKKANF